MTKRRRPKKPGSDIASSKKPIGPVGVALQAWPWAASAYGLLMALEVIRGGMDRIVYLPGAHVLMAVWTGLALIGMADHRGWLRRRFSRGVSRHDTAERTGATTFRELDGSRVLRAVRPIVLFGALAGFVLLDLKGAEFLVFALGTVWLLWVRRGGQALVVIGLVFMGLAAAGETVGWLGMSAWAAVLCWEVLLIAVAVAVRDTFRDRP